MISTILIWRT